MSAQLMDVEAMNLCEGNSVVTLWKLLLLLNSTAYTPRAQEKITKLLNTKEGILAQAQYSHTKKIISMITIQLQKNI